MIALKKRSLQTRFMNRIEQESLAGRFQSFDTELPPSARTELVAPRRPRILGRKTPATLPEPSTKGPLYLVLLVAAMVIGGAATTLWRQQEAERAWAPGAAKADWIDP